MISNMDAQGWIIAGACCVVALVGTFWLLSKVWRGWYYSDDELD